MRLVVVLLDEARKRLDLVGIEGKLFFGLSCEVGGVGTVGVVLHRVK